MELPLTTGTLWN